MLIPTTGPLHELFPLPGMPFSQMFALFRCQLREALPDHPPPLSLTPSSFLPFPSLFFSTIFFFNYCGKIHVSFPGGSAVESTCKWRRYRKHCFDPWLGTIPWKRAWPPTPVFLSGKFHRQRSLAGCSPSGHRVRTWLSTCTQVQSMHHAKFTALAIWKCMFSDMQYTHAVAPP